jgi:hypothetical protein
MSIQGDSRGPLGSAITVNLNAVGDTFVPIPCKQFIPRNITVTNASVTLAGSASTIGVYTAPSAGGTAIVTPSVSTTLTSSTVFADKTIAAATTVFTPAYDSTAKAWGVYVRVALVHGTAATLDLYIFGDAIK